MQTYFVMVYKQKNTLLDEFINDFSEAKLSKAELQSFSELLDNEPALRHTALSGIKARKNLSNLSEIKCRPGFDQRMAAKFSMEIEREIQFQNGSSSSVAKASF
ncbi:hypothetical protein BH23BAC3_BH23BAC3_12010 [soil metagenome]